MDQNKKSLEDNVDNGSNVETVSAIEKIVCNPGLQHIMEEICWHLCCNDFFAFQKVNKSCKEFIDDPRFWENWYTKKDSETRRKQNLYILPKKKELPEEIKDNWIKFILKS